MIVSYIQRPDDNFLKDTQTFLFISHTHTHVKISEKRKVMSTLVGVWFRAKDKVIHWSS